MRLMRVVPREGESIMRIGAREVRLTNLDKIFFPALGLTKSDLIQYYLDMAPYVVHQASRRPMHVRSSHENALPLIMTHGWPGSVIEMIDSVGPLTDPTAHGGSAEDASTSCCPRCRGTASRASRSRSAGT
jgi:Epoxide hydrolase N terminus